MTDTKTVNGYRESAVNRWSMGVPVPLAEQKDRYCDGPEHQGKLFRVSTLYVFPARWGSEHITWKLFGPNIRQNGTPGKYTLARKISRDYAAEEYPQALAALDGTLHDLKVLVRSDADAACEQIDRALPATEPVQDEQEITT